MRGFDGSSVPETSFGFLRPGEVIDSAARPSYAIVGGGDWWDIPFLLLTNQRLVVSRAPLFGKPKLNYSCDWGEVLSVTGQLWNGTGPKVQVLVQSSQPVLELLDEPMRAYDIETNIRSAYSTLGR